MSKQQVDGRDVQKIEKSNGPAASWLERRKFKNGTAGVYKGERMVGAGQQICCQVLFSLKNRAKGRCRHGGLIR